ncbi:MAG: LysR family transcriptional regulator [Myxococcota bacterium]
MLEPQALSWDHLKDLLSLARAGSLSAAANRQQIAVSTLSRRLDALERTLGGTLFVRRHDGLHATPLGERTLQRASEVEQAVADLLRDVEQTPEVSGRVRVSASPLLVDLWVVPAVAPLVAQHPALQVHVSAHVRIVSVQQGQTDLAVRLVRPRGDQLVGRSLGTHASVLAWSESYAEEHPVDPDTLGHHRFVGYPESWDPSPEMQWILERVGAGAVALRCPTTVSIVDAVHAGAGIALIPWDLASGLQTSTVDGTLPGRTAWLLRHRDAVGNPALDAVSNAIADRAARGLVGVAR